MSNIISKSITLELEGTTISDAYFNEYGECIINVIAFFKSNLGDYSIKKTINISNEEAWGHTKEELRHIVDTLGIDDSPPVIKVKPMRDDEPLDIETVKVKDVSGFF